MSDLFKALEAEQNAFRQEVLTLKEYLELCKVDGMGYASAAERMLNAIGEPELVNTHADPRLSRIFSNRTIRRYPAFNDFYGMEDSVERIVGYFKHSAQGLEEKKQILYLLGPVGGGKSSLAERLKELIQKCPIYVLADKDGNMSPVFETPLGLFGRAEFGAILEKEYNIPQRYLTDVMSPWAVKRLKDYNGDKTKFKVVKVYPSKLEQLGVIKTEPGDDNNQDISNLVGKTNIRMLEHFDQNDPDSYSFSGALCRGNQGLVEFVEMFKAPIKMLHPLLTATQEGNYVGTEGISAIPFNGIVLAHSNESEWQTFKNNKNNEAFIDRVYVVKVPYCLRITDEKNIYAKMLENSSLSNAACATETLNILSKFCVLTRLSDHENSNLYSKMRVYDGETIKDSDPRAKSLQEYRDAAGVDEGMSGISTRFAFKILSKTFNFDPAEVAADPVHLMFVMEQAIKQEQFGEDRQAKFINFIKEYLAPKYAEQLGTEIQKAYLESYSDYGQNLFNRYIEYADAWIQEIDYKDPDTGNLFDRTILNKELEKVEKAAGISNPKDFRNEVVNFVIRATAKNGGQVVKWTSYEKLREVIEKKMFASTEELLPIISFAAKSSNDDQKKHDEFVSRMMEKGYTEKQVKRLVEWYMRTQKSS
jgi:serine protein kinase